MYSSARLSGRAPGGFADLLQRYATDPTAACDAALEPTSMLLRRLRWPAKLRRLHGTAGLAAAALAAHALENAVVPQPGLGAFWAATEVAASSLQRRRVLQSQLSAEVTFAERVVRASAARRADTPPSALTT